MRRLIHACVALLTFPSALVGTSSSTTSDSTRWLSPIEGSSIVRSFDVTSTYGPGHRGIDLEARKNSEVRVVASGRVTWAGKVAGRHTVTVQHGSERSTYEPVKPSVKIGQHLTQGDVLGTLSDGHGNCGSACLHLGRIAGGTYLDPAEKFETSDGFRLISPEGAPPTPPAIALVGGSIPAAGQLTSRFGTRVDPFTGSLRFHNGIDFGAPCGTPVFSAGTGTVVRAQTRGGYGLLVEVQHGANTRTGYAHLSTIKARVGDRVKRGSLIGRVGTTGRSTGCHLHFMKFKAGRPVNPA